MMCFTYDHRQHGLAIISHPLADEKMTNIHVLLLVVGWLYVQAFI